MAYPIDLNRVPPTVMHLDINSCFATLEQQSNPLYRGVPLVVAAYNAPYGCILAASKEAKLWGVKTGMRVDEGKARCPFLITREADPDKYRFIHYQLKNILDEYSDRVYPKSIDEFVINLSHTPHSLDLEALTKRLKTRIRREVGEWITVSVGVGPNRFLAKLGSDIDKPDGFKIISYLNLLSIYSRISLTDFCGINHRLAHRLKEQGIFTPTDFLSSSLTVLRGAFRSVLARDWYLRVRGYEVDEVEFDRRSFGQSYVLPRPMKEKDWFPIMNKLVDKAGSRMRGSGFGARGAHLYLSFGSGGSWGQGHKSKELVFTNSDLSALIRALYRRCPFKLSVKQIAISFFELSPLENMQLALTQDLLRTRDLTLAIDHVNNLYGPYTLHSASMLGSSNFVPDRIAFGK